MIIPFRVDARWISSLDDTNLLTAEQTLHEDFRLHERTEKDRSGARYMLLNGPSPLVNAWLRWLLVSNAARTRGLVVHRHR
jgi:hypothetical protein